MSGLSSFQQQQKPSNPAASTTMERRQQETRFSTVRAGVDYCLSLLTYASWVDRSDPEGRVKLQEGMLSVWARNIGAYGSERNSLEYKLRGSPHVLADLLYSLQHLAEQVEEFTDRLTGKTTMPGMEEPQPDDEQMVPTQVDHEWDLPQLRSNIKEAVAYAMGHTTAVRRALRD